MDQVTTFMETKLSAYKRSKDDKILTKTMINNYAKAKLFPAPVKKKYNRNHLMLLVIIYHLKSVLSINDIDILLKPITTELTTNAKSKTLEVVYSNFLIIQKSIKTSELGHSLANKQILEALDIDQSMKNIETIENILLVLILAIFSNTEKRLAEKVLDMKFK
ncbi:hypothetical protein SDC9_108880 [bioreactor metagenome]|uniref:DUF1836 domain-containing protein n=1 Tax=bioreactor metagenome TaxID=1076179 RepID=A0A645B9A8_9ZZZZ